MKKRLFCYPGKQKVWAVVVALCSTCLLVVQAHVVNCKIINKIFIKKRSQKKPIVGEVSVKTNATKTYRLHFTTNVYNKHLQKFICFLYFRFDCEWNNVKYKTLLPQDSDKLSLGVDPPFKMGGLPLKFIKPCINIEPPKWRSACIFHQLKVS